MLLINFFYIFLVFFCNTRTIINDNDNISKFLFSLFIDASKNKTKTEFKKAQKILSNALYVHIVQIDFRGMKKNKKKFFLKKYL
jgi:hypothetical protein